MPFQLAVTCNSSLQRQNILLLQSMINSLARAQLGRKKTTERIAQRFHWFGLS